MSCVATPALTGISSKVFRVALSLGSTGYLAVPLASIHHIPAAVPKHDDKDVFKHCQMSSGAKLHPVKKALSWMEKYYHQLIFAHILMVCGTVPTAHLLPGSSHGDKQNREAFRMGSY